MKPIKYLPGIMLLITALAGAAPLKFDIVFAKFSANDDPRQKFPLAVLDLAMRKMHAKYTIRPSTETMERGRALLELEKPQRINLAFTSMASEAEKRLRPIRIPISRGLVGFRLFLINKEKQSAFAAVHNLDDLRQFRGGVGLGWIDADVMQQARLPILRDKYDTLFKMTHENIVDYFPRGANEIFAELETHRKSQPALAIENHLMLVYRNDIIFYTSKNDELLASTIEKGMLAAYDDGSYMKLFNEHPYIQQVLRDAGFNKRTRIDIPNPVLSEQDRAIPAKFWIK
jgi:hypothetical protein